MAQDHTQETTGYTEQSQSAFATEETTVVNKKPKASGKLIMLLAGGFFLLMVALFAFNAYKKATTPAPAQPQPSPVAVDPAAVDAQPSTEFAPADPAAAPVDPMGGDPMASAPSDADLFGAPPVQPGQPTQPEFQSADQQFDPNAFAGQPGSPTDPNAAPPVGAPSPLQQQVQQDPASSPAPVQVTVQPVQDPAQPDQAALTQPASPASATDAVSALDRVRADIMAGFDELRSSIEGLSARQDRFETTTNQRFDAFERRLSGVESGRPAASAPARKPAAPARKATPVAAKPKSTPRPAQRAAPAPERRNSFEIIAPARREHVVTSMVQTAPAVLVQEPAVYVAPAPAPVSFCPPSAVQPGRFWVRQPDGSFQSYGEGDRFGRGTISRIDPAAGIFVDGALVCAGR